VQIVGGSRELGDWNLDKAVSMVETSSGEAYACRLALLSCFVD
jgi:hypothetical protein